jgi:hypothetical protein
MLLGTPGNTVVFLPERGKEPLLEKEGESMPKFETRPAVIIVLVLM